MNKLALATTAAVAILTIAGLTGTGAARAQIVKAVRAVEHPGSLRSAFSFDPSMMTWICQSRLGALDVVIDANGHPVFRPNALDGQDCR